MQYSLCKLINEDYVSMLLTAASNRVPY